MPITPVTTALFERLDALKVAETHPARAGIRHALGVWPGDVPTDEIYPVLGYHVSTTLNPVNLTCYLATAGKFVRYEWTPDATLLFMCGVERVTSVSERTTVAGLELTLELDAQATISEVQAQSATVAEGTVGTIAQIRQERTKYVVVAEEEHDVLALAQFSLGLRTAMSMGA